MFVHFSRIEFRKNIGENYMYYHAPITMLPWATAHVAYIKPRYCVDQNSL